MKNWLRKGTRGGNEASRELTVDELVSLGRLEDARQMLEERVKGSSRDRRSLVKLAEVLLALERKDESLELYEAAAKSYAADGFHDRGIAVLRKMLKIAPGHPRAAISIDQLEQAKRLEAKRAIVHRNLSRTTDTGARGFDSLQLAQSWRNLSKSPLVRNLETNLLGRLFAQLKPRDFDPQEEIVARKDELEELFVVAEGSVEVIEKRADGAPIVLRTYEAGDVFGESALLEHQPWAAAHRAQGSTRLLCLDRDGLTKLLPGLEDPRGFLDSLRTQGNDASLAEMVGQRSS